MSDQNTEILREMEAIKGLLILLVAKLGADSKEIAMVLDIADSTVRNMISLSKIEKIKFELEKNECED